MVNVSNAYNTSASILYCSALFSFWKFDFLLYLLQMIVYAFCNLRIILLFPL